MTYQALARKYRPRQFGEVVGQQHVVSALSNALSTDRVHHALLFSGTRGVGKTTLARIFAKSLNCETKGVSAEPCGQCGSCVSVDEGRFIDLIEVDAASRTKVEDTRELLDNVQYAPTQGAYKVYLIDEVHMLSKSSFNALLKTLEEPPPHVKFLLATTDPQKLPVTVLSRCLQFNLRALQIEEIQNQLTLIVGEEQMSAEAAALNVLARSAQGSMRDALSLLDQAVAHGGGEIAEAGVRDMLGMIDEQFTVDLLKGLAANDAPAILTTVAAMAERSSDYSTALDDVLLAMHGLAMEAHAPGELAKSGRDLSVVTELGTELSPEDIQLFYQLGLVAKRDIAMAPDSRSGFEMAMLRMLAYRPVAVDEAATPPPAPPSSGGAESAAAPPPPSGASGPAMLRQKLSDELAAAGSKPAAAASAAVPPAAVVPAAAPADVPVMSEDPAAGMSEDPGFAMAPPGDDLAAQLMPVGPDEAVAPVQASVEVPVDIAAPVMAIAPDAQRAQAQPATAGPDALSARVADEPVATPVVESPVNTTADVDVPADVAETAAGTDANEHGVAADISATAERISPESILTTAGWEFFIHSSDLDGIAAELARNAMPASMQGDNVHLVVDAQSEQLLGAGREQRLAEALSAGFGRTINLTVETGQPPAITPAAAVKQSIAARQQAAEAAIHADPTVRALMQRFGATIIADSIRPATGDET